MKVIELMRRFIKRLGDCFSPQAQVALAGARKEAERMNHNFVATEHLLLGMIRHGPGIGVMIMREMGISPELVCTKVEEFVGFAPPGKLANPVPYTRRVKKTLALAGKEVKALKHPYVGAQHILVGLCAQTELPPRFLASLATRSKPRDRR